MCLNVDSDRTSRWYAQNKEYGCVRVWKRFGVILPYAKLKLKQTIITGDTLNIQAWYLTTRVPFNAHNVISAHNPLPRYSTTKKPKYINGGAIHAYFRESQTISLWREHYIALPMWGNVNDMIAVGDDNDIAFRRLYFDDHTLDVLNNTTVVIVEGLSQREVYNKIARRITANLQHGHMI